jgi:hypothetical protein
MLRSAAARCAPAFLRLRRGASALQRQTRRRLRAAGRTFCGTDNASSMPLPATLAALSHACFCGRAVCRICLPPLALLSRRVLFLLLWFFLGMLLQMEGLEGIAGGD